MYSIKKYLKKKEKNYKCKLNIIGSNKKYNYILNYILTGINYLLRYIYIYMKIIRLKEY
jgi:hypothetical protein